MTARAEVFGQGLRDVVSPELAPLGFVFDRSRTYRRMLDGGRVVEIINFQLGQRSLEGRFTVNLGKLSNELRDDVALEKAYPYHCRTQTRIGLVLPPRSPRLANLPVLGPFFAPRDRWWRFSDDRTLTFAQLRQVTRLTVSHAVPWLEQSRA
jgi:hypothetical protein